MLKILSIQSDILGNATYGATLRECFRDYRGFELDSYWYKDERSLTTRLINRAASFTVPIIGRKGWNLDRRFARVEWSYGRTSRLLAKQKLERCDYDVLHFHTQVQAFGCEALMKHIPTIVTIDRTAYQTSREHDPRFARTFEANIRMEQKVFDAALHVVTWSDWARRSVIGEHGLKESKVSTIPPGARLWEMGDPVFERKAKPRILFVGHDFERKGGWDLLNVFLDHFSDKAELHLVTKALQFDRPLKNVSVHTGVSSYTKPWHDLFRDSDIFVLLSRNEPFGLALQEAGGYGLALIGSNVGAIPELVRDGSNGFVIEPGDRLQLERCLRVLIEDHDLRMRIRRQSRQVALEAFDARKNYARLAALFSLAGACTQGKMSHACSG